ncbi:MAG: hypothetical protein ACRDIY_20225 [Chloroflexota bacterium]
MSDAKADAARRPARGSSRPVPATAEGEALAPVTLGDRALVAYLQRTAGNHAVNQLVQRYGRQPTAWLAATRDPSPARAGSPHPDLATVRRAPLTAASHAPTHAEQFNDDADLITGFQQISVAAVNQGGRGLDTWRPGPDLSPTHRRLLSQIKDALIAAQEPSPDAKQAAAAEWPALATRLRAELARAREVGLPGWTIDTLLDNLELVSETCIFHPSRRKDANREGSEDYKELDEGVYGLWQARVKNYRSAEDTKKAMADVQFGGHLTRSNRGTLEKIRKAILLVYSNKPGSAAAALTLWESVQGDLAIDLRRETEFGGDAAATQKNLNLISEQIIRPAAAREAHQEAVAHSDLQAPDLVFQQKRLDEAERQLETAEQLVEEIGKLTGQGVGAAILHDAPMGKELFEYLTLPGTIEEKLEWAKGKGLLAKTATAADLVSKISGGVKTIVASGLEVGKAFAERQMASALAKDLEKEAENWKGIAERYEGKLKLLGKIGTVLGLIGVAADVLRGIRAALNGDWEGALKETGGAAMDLLGVLGPADAGPLLGAITITIKAEIEAIHLAADFIRYCKAETVRQAAQDFIEACAGFAKNYAYDFVADVDLLLDPSRANISDLVGKQLATHTAAIGKGVTVIASQVSCTEPGCLGGHPDLVSALGQPALTALNGLSIPDDPLSKAQQIRDVFAGANAMANYVQAKYPRGDQAGEKADEGESQNGAE